jgi:hydroxymethylpyrimidine pyrophosphatase-like HAD family hydrolase
MEAIYRAAADDWIAQLGAQRFAAVVLDYDGTVCWTSRRRELPEPTVRDALQGLLEAGMVVAFASGRGKSLHHDLRRWLPQALWPRVLLGLYNGAVRVRLDGALGDLRSPTRWSTSVVAALENWPFRSRVDLEERGAQVTVEVVGRGFEHGRLDELVRERLATAGVAAQVVASGHSMDIVAAETSKTTVVEYARDRCDAPVLTIGDQGQVGGNDHAMLAQDPFSLTVDRCSADPSRCWYAGSGEQVGPDLLVRYLRALRLKDSRRREVRASRGTAGCSYGLGQGRVRRQGSPSRGDGHAQV